LFCLLLLDGDVPDSLLDCRLIGPIWVLWSLSQYAKEFEERLKAVLEEVTKSEVRSFFIDEIPSSSAGALSRSMDASNLLKPGCSWTTSLH
jgi:ATP-dependent Clp protease ATP-binding subunit ClpB